MTREYGHRMYLLDGNNIMGQRVGWHRDKPAAMGRLIGELQQLAECLETQITVVFDAPTGKLPQQLGRLRVCYARAQETADDCIVALAKQQQGDVRLTAVTSDRNLTRRLMECGVAVTRSGAFRRLIDSYRFRPL